MTDTPAQPTPENAYITLVQFLKMVDAAPTGGQAKMLARGGDVRVNGQPEQRPGRKLRTGDVVEHGTARWTVDIKPETG
ncbi:MAG: RNA-binding S4 domain-containing protein [Planctomycetes bacterium]|nr:RNA-binding S4 domain-containing protein [Planctomycetota bacterium]